MTNLISYGVLTRAARMKLVMQERLHNRSHLFYSRGDDSDGFTVPYGQTCTQSSRMCTGV